MSLRIIYLDLCCRKAQATYLKRDGQPHRLYPVLLRMGFTCALSVTSKAVVSYTALPPLPGNTLGGIFLLHWPWSRLHRTLSGILPCEARTFLTCGLSALQPRLLVLLAFVLYHNFLSKKQIKFMRVSPFILDQRIPVGSRGCRVHRTAHSGDARHGL